jgi:hypothetical protein
VDLHRFVEHAVQVVGGEHHRRGGDLVDLAAAAAADFQFVGRAQRLVGERRIDSTHTYMSASLAWIIWKSAIGLPNCFRVRA